MIYNFLKIIQYIVLVCVVIGSIYILNELFIYKRTNTEEYYSKREVDSLLKQKEDRWQVPEVTPDDISRWDSLETDPIFLKNTYDSIIKK